MESAPRDNSLLPHSSLEDITVDLYVFILLIFLGAGLWGQRELGLSPRLAAECYVILVKFLNLADFLFPHL